MERGERRDRSSMLRKRLDQLLDAIGLLGVAGYIVLAADGSTLGVVLACASVVLTLGIRQVKRRLGAPKWSPSESYISSLRRWRASRREGG
jgi:hypothetical protein